MRTGKFVSTFLSGLSIFGIRFCDRVAQNFFNRHYTLREYVRAESIIELRIFMAILAHHTALSALKSSLSAVCPQKCSPTEIAGVFVLFGAHMCASRIGALQSRYLGYR